MPITLTDQFNDTVFRFGLRSQCGVTPFTCNGHPLIEACFDGKQTRDPKACTSTNDSLGAQARRMIATNLNQLVLRNRGNGQGQGSEVIDDIQFGHA